MKKSIQETTKIMSKTKPNGETNFEPMDSDVADKLNGTEITDSDGDRVKIKDTGRTITEDDTSKHPGQKLETQDIMNITKDLNTVVKDTLREHGDTVAYTEPKVNVAKTHTVIYVHYEQDPDNPGKPSEDKFVFKYSNNKVYLEDIEICPLTKQSGTLTINKDLAKNGLMFFLDKSEDSMGEGTSTEGDYPNGQGFESKDMEAQDSYKTDDNELSEELLLGFRKAADAYKANPKDKETIKELFRQARNFEGDSIQAKLKNAIKQYLASNSSEEVEPTEEPVIATATDEPQVVSSQDDRTCPCDIVMDMSLFIRLLEFTREEMPDDDIPIHIVAENLDKICKEKGHACMSDYEDIIAGVEADNHEKEDMDEGTMQDFINMNSPFADAGFVKNYYNRKNKDNNTKKKSYHEPYDPYPRNKFRQEPTQECVDLSEVEEDDTAELQDVLRRARNLDKCQDQELKDAVMDELAEIFDAAESLESSIESYIKHTIPQATVQGFKQAVDNVLANPEKYIK